MVGISLPTTGASVTLPFVAANVEFLPADFTGRITDDWATVPFCNDDFADYTNPATDHLSRVNDPTVGIGDVCRYMGVVDGANWRMPTAAEWTELYGSAEADKGQAIKLGNGWGDGYYYALSGYAMGSERNFVSIIGNGADARVFGANKIDGAVFFSASGRRNWDNGSIWGIGSHGLYWPSTAATATSVCHMQFSSLNIWPRASNSRANAFPIRCIRE